MASCASSSSSSSASEAPSTLARRRRQELHALRAALSRGEACRLAAVRTAAAAQEEMVDLQARYRSSQSQLRTLRAEMDASNRAAERHAAESATLLREQARRSRDVLLVDAKVRELALHLQPIVLSGVSNAPLRSLVDEILACVRRLRGDGPPGPPSQLVSSPRPDERWASWAAAAPAPPPPPPLSPVVRAEVAERMRQWLGSTEAGAGAAVDSRAGGAAEGGRAAQAHGRSARASLFTASRGEGRREAEGAAAARWAGRDGAAKGGAEASQKARGGGGAGMGRGAARPSGRVGALPREEVGGLLRELRQVLPS